MDRSTDKTYLFEQMPASQAVRRQILPAIASQMVLLAYNLADTYFVGLLTRCRRRRYRWRTPLLY